MGHLRESHRSGNVGNDSNKMSRHDRLDDVLVKTLLTVDARVEKIFRVAGARVAAAVDVFNLLNTAHEIEENVVTTPSFRSPVLNQPPRAIRVGFRVEL